MPTQDEIPQFIVSLPHKLPSSFLLSFESEMSPQVHGLDACSSAEELFWMA